MFMLRDFACFSIDLFPLSGNIQNFNSAVWNKSAGIKKVRGEPGEKIEGVYACVHGLGCYWVISLEDCVHENYGTLLSVFQTNVKAVLM